MTLMSLVGNKYWQCIWKVSMKIFLKRIKNIIGYYIDAYWEISDEDRCWIHAWHQFFPFDDIMKVWLWVRLLGYKKYEEVEWGNLWLIGMGWWAFIIKKPLCICTLWQWFCILKSHSHMDSITITTNKYILH